MKLWGSSTGLRSGKNVKVGKHFTWVLSSYPKIMTLERVKGKGPKIMILEKSLLWLPGDDPRKYPGRPKGICFKE